MSSCLTLPCHLLTITNISLARVLNSFGAVASSEIALKNTEALDLSPFFKALKPKISRALCRHGFFESFKDAALVISVALLSFASNSAKAHELAIFVDCTTQIATFTHKCSTSKFSEHRIPAICA